MTHSHGPLHGIKVIELAGLAPASFAGLVLSDYGADLVRIDRRSSNPDEPTNDSLTRGKRSIALNLKDVNDKKVFLDLIRVADVLIEGYRPGVMESLGLGPEDCLKTNKMLIYARLTGFRRTGKYSQSAGHDINYLALSGALHAIGPRARPWPPINLLGDFAGGGLTCALGVLMALFSRQSTGSGTVVEANMVDGVSYLGKFTRHTQKMPEIYDGLLDGRAPFYRYYETKDGKFIALGALEPDFYQTFLSKFGLQVQDEEQATDQSRPNWSRLEVVLARRFRELTQAQWSSIYKDTDACVTPVLDTIPPTIVPVHLAEFAGLPHQRTHRDSLEAVGLRPGQDQASVMTDWLDLCKAKI